MADSMLGKIDSFLTDTEDPDTFWNFPYDPGTDPGYSSGEVVRMVRWLRDQHTQWGVRWQEQYDRAERAQQERDAAYAAAVHKAALLRQARLLADVARFAAPEDEDSFWPELVDLLDLLSPAPDEEGT